MTHHDAAHHPQDRLEGWGEIAAHFGRDQRTVQRWQKLGLPIHRYVVGNKSAIFAIRGELQEWFNSLEASAKPEAAPAAIERPAEVPADVKSAPVPFGPGMMAATALLVVAAAGALWTWLLPAIASHRTVQLPMPAGEPHRLFARATAEAGVAPALVKTGRHPSQLVLSPDESELYASDNESRTVTVIRTRDRAISKVIPLDGRPTRLAMAADGQSVYVGNLESGLAIIDTRTKKVTSIPTAGQVMDIAVTPDGRKVFLAMVRQGLKRLDLSSREMLLPVGRTVCPVSLALAGRYLYVGSRCGGPGGRVGHDAIDVLDIETESSIATFSGPPMVAGPLRLSVDQTLLWIDGADACSAPYYDHAGCTTAGGVAHVFRLPDRTLLRSFASPRLNYQFADVGRDRAVLFNQDWSTVVDTTSWKELERVPWFSEAGVLSRDSSTFYLSLPREGGVGILPVARGSCEPPDADRQLHFTGDGVMSDVVGGYHLTAQGDLTFAPGRVGQAFYFDGVSTLLSSHARGIDLLEGDNTLAFWVRFERDKSSLQPLIDNAAKGAAWQVSRTDGRLRLDIQEPGRVVLESATAVTPRAWHHVAIVKDGQNLALYLDGHRGAAGRLRASISAARTPSAGFQLGANQARRAFFHGMLDELVLYQRALSPAKIGRLAGCVNPVHSD